MQNNGWGESFATGKSKKLNGWEKKVLLVRWASGSNDKRWQRIWRPGLLSNTSSTSLNFLVVYSAFLTPSHSLLMFTLFIQIGLVKWEQAVLYKKRKYSQQCRSELVSQREELNAMCKVNSSPMSSSVDTSFQDKRKVAHTSHRNRSPGRFCISDIRKKLRFVSTRGVGLTIPPVLFVGLKFPINVQWTMCWLYNLSYKTYLYLDIPYNL